jgi:hypothetical protein
MKIPRQALAISAILAIGFLAATSSLITIAPVLAVGAGTNKVTICHIPPGNPANAHSDTVGEPAVAAHIRDHGDYLGACHR